MIIILMGVAGSGKTTVGELLSAALGWEFHEGDDFHSQANVEKMRRGEALDDTSRGPWLDSLADLIADAAGSGRSAIIACSALKQAYRDRLARGHSEVKFVHLMGECEMLERRLVARPEHYFGSGLLASQFDALEEPRPDEALVVDARQDPATLVAEIRQALQL